MPKRLLDGEEAWNLFWESFKREAPMEFALQQRIVHTFEKAWKGVNPLVRLQYPVTFAVTSEGTIEAQMPACLLLGCIAAAAVTSTEQRTAETSDRKLKELDGRCQEALQGIQARLDRLETDLGITGRPEDV